MTEKSWAEEKMQDIEYNLKTIREEIARAAALSGRSEQDIDFMAVTKTVDEMFINHAIACGIDLIGENKVQEMLRKKPNLNICGLMTIPPICEKNTELCKFFTNIYNMYVDIGAKKLDNVSMNILSMGMSGDYAEAIRSGSNHIRVGSKIFGPRIY